MQKFTDESVKEHIKLALSPSINKDDHKKASDFLIEYYGEIFDSHSTHLKSTVIALEHLNRNKPDSFVDWFLKPSLVRLFIFALGLAVGWLSTNSDKIVG